MTQNADFASILERLAGPEPTDAALTEAATWLTRVLNVLADCGYRLSHNGSLVTP